MEILLVLFSREVMVKVALEPVDLLTEHMALCGSLLAYPLSLKKPGLGVEAQLLLT